MPTDPQEESFKYWSIFLVILIFILFVGWKQPLRYRFMSQSAIDALEHPVTPTPVPTPRARAPWEPPPAAPTPKWMWDPKRKSPLENAPTRTN